MNKLITTRRPFKWRAPQLLIFSFLLVIAVGFLLLLLPISSSTGQAHSFLDTLFTATSAVCVSGLTTINTATSWSLFGQFIILIMIQIGGLGLVTFLTASIQVLKHQISTRELKIVQASFNLDKIGGIRNFILRIVRITLTIEAIGAVFLTVGFLLEKKPFLESLKFGIFHAVSAFCNAGFDILGAHSLRDYQNNPLIMITISALILLGGIGFVVIFELADSKKKFPKLSFKRRLSRLSLHTKMALTVSAILIVIGALFFLILESYNAKTFGPESIWDKITGSLFESIALRTAGFSTFSQSLLTDYSKLIASIMMLIGGSPASTSGGIKTVTVGIILVVIISAIRGRDQLIIFNRRISLKLLQRALTITAMMLAIVLVAILGLHFTEIRHGVALPLVDLIFEASSAIGTTGLTTGITEHLSMTGKVIMIFCMFIGRLSPITIVIGLNMRQKVTPTFIKENVIVG